MPKAEKGIFQAIANRLSPVGENKLHVVDLKKSITTVIETPAGIPNPFDEGIRIWYPHLLDVIEVANKETGVVYRKPKDIRKGDDFSVFQWYFYDGVARMLAIRMGIPLQDKEGKKLQEPESDWIACAFVEAVVVLAEKGDVDARETVQSMLNMNFIEKGWNFTDNIVERAIQLFH
jgi:hypothetical protein